MNADIYATLEIICWVCATIAGGLAAWYRVLNVFYSAPDDISAVQARYRARWQRLRDGRYIELPELGVQWLLSVKARLPRISAFFLRTLGTVLPIGEENNIARNKIMLVLLLLPGVVSIWILYGMSSGIKVIVLALILVLLSRVKKSSILQIFNIRGDTFLVNFFGIFILISWLATLQLALTLDIYWTVLLLLFLSPIFGLIAFSTLNIGTLIFDDNSMTDLSVSNLHNESVNFGFAFTLSFSITALALLIGSLAVSQAHLPQTIQMFLTNVLCDGVTLFLTFRILQGAVDRVVLNMEESIPEKDTPRTIKKKYPIPVAIAIDIIVAALLACLSLYLGLLGSDYALSIPETVNVLLARTPSGTSYELGPYFWAMHTTFIPTLIYLTVIALAYIAKLFVLPFFRVLQKGHELDKPHNLTMTVFLFVAFIFLNLVGLLKYIAPDPVASV